MAEARETLNREKRARITTGKTNGKTTEKATRKATARATAKTRARPAGKATETAGSTVRKKRAARREAPTNVDGLELLREMADQRLVKKSTELAKVLEKKALEGDVVSAKMLVMLAERKKPRELPVKKPSAAAYIYKLETEPQWEEQGPREQGDKGTRDVGTREQ